MRKLFEIFIAIFIISLPLRDSLSEAVGFNFPTLFGIPLVVLFVVLLLKGEVTLNKNLFSLFGIFFFYQVFIAVINQLRGFDLNITYLISYIQYYLVIFIIAAYAFNEHNFIKVLKFIVFGIFILSMYAVISFILNKETAIMMGHNNYRATGGVRNPSFLAMYGVLNIVIIFNLIREKLLTNRLVYYSIAMISFISFLLAMMRSGYVTFIILIIWYFFASIKRFSILTAIKYFIIFTFLIIISLLVLDYFGILQVILDRFAFMQGLMGIAEGADSSSDKRLTVMIGAVQILYDNLLIGIGPGNLVNELFIKGYTTWHRSAENTFLHLLNDFGVLFILVILPSYLILIKGKLISFKIFPQSLLKEVFLVLILFSMFDNNVSELTIYVIFGLYFSKVNFALKGAFQNNI